MRKIEYSYCLSLAYFIILTLFFLCIGLSQDRLLFRSDFLSFFLLCLGLSFLLYLPCLFIISICFILCSDLFSKKLVNVLSFISITNICFGLLIFWFDRFIYTIGSLRYFLVLVAVTYSIAAMFTYVFLNKKEIFASVINISQLTTILSSVALVFLLFFQHYEKNNASRSYPQKKNIIMIVMDGLSTEFLQPYNPLADITEFKEISQDSILYTHMHTNFPTTQNFFKILYYGNKSKATKGKNLLSTLQENGITVRWSTFYNGGLPDSNKIKYKGLRSAFLTQNFTGLAHLLGLDYNIFRYWTSRRGKPMGPREIKLCVLTNKFFKKKDAFQVHLIEEIERLRNDRRPFFFVFHILPQAETSDEEQGPWRTPSGNTDLDKIIAKIQEEQDYSYPLEQAWAVDEMRKNYAQGVKRGIKKLKQFYDTFKKRGWGEDTLLIITADHGQKFSKGKVWYSFHHEEEVTRVPLIIYYKDVKGTDERLAETIDITQTILDYFGIRERFSDNAQSLLGSYREKIVTSLMKDSKKRKEQFLSVYKDGYKYVFNIYPQGKFLTQKCKIEGFDTIPVEEGEIVLEKLDFSLKDILAEYGIKR